MIDAENSQVSAATMARIHEMNALEESNAVKSKAAAMEDGSTDHVEGATVSEGKV